VGPSFGWGGALGKSVTHMRTTRRTLSFTRRAHSRKKDASGEEAGICVLRSMYRSVKKNWAGGGGWGDGCGGSLGTRRIERCVDPGCLDW